MNDFLSKKDLLEHYSNDDALTTLSQRSEKEKDELLLALGGDALLKKKEKISRDKKTIKQLCLSKLSSIILVEDTSKNTTTHQQLDSSLYNEQLATHKQHYLLHLEQGEQKGDIIRSHHVFDHVTSHISKYTVGSLIEKIKHTRGLAPLFSTKNWENKKEITKEYLSLNPDKVDIAVIDFFKTRTSKETYTEEENILLKQWLLDNHEFFKDILFSYTSFILPKENGYSEEETDRIVFLEKYGCRAYLLSESSSLRYTEKHLGNYRGNTVRFHIFPDKTHLFGYLDKELTFMPAQIERFNQAISYFTEHSVQNYDREYIENAYKQFSFHGTDTDKLITKKLGQLLSPEKRGEKAIITSIIACAQIGIKESQTKATIMKKHLEALKKNLLF